LIELRAVTKRFGNLLAVRNLSFRCGQRQFVVIFGPAGAGKSTTLRLIAGLSQPSYGEIFFNDQPLAGVPPERRNFSMVFENYALYSHLSTFENLAFPLRAHKVPEVEIKRLVFEMADLLHISETLDRKPGFLSGGQRQRVALGRGLIRQADLYLLDEPISHLDARLRIQMRVELKSICSRKQSSVIHVTHDYREAMALADRVIVLNKGRLMQDASPQDVYHRPDNEFVARFVGNPPMSIVAAQLVSKESKLHFRIADTLVFVPVATDFNGNAAARAGKSGELRLGVRAIETSLSPTRNEEHNAPVDVYLVESQGHRNLVTTKLGEDLVQVVTPPGQSWKVGERAWLSLHGELLHVFADGQALYHPALQSDSRSFEE
jgi:multiple sugar transport system ATP-binding protein